MNLLFLNPPFKDYFSRTSRSPAVSKAKTLYYPLWPCFAAAACEKDNHNVYVIDAIAKKSTIVDILKKIDEFKTDILVIDTSTPSIHNDIKVLVELKNHRPSIFTVLVGTHVSALPDWTLDQAKEIDAVAIGEYDYTIKNLANTIEKKEDLRNVSGLCFRSKDGTFIKNKKAELIDNLDEIPFVSKIFKRFLDPKDYYFAAASFPMMMMITGRGCPFKCFFCVYPQTFHSRKYRLRSAQNVVDEFSYIKENFPEVKEIGIEDDTFTANKKRTIDICKLLIKRKINLKWYCNVRADLDYETMKWMKKAKCRLLTIGFESGNSEILKNMHKGITTKMSYQFMKNARKARLLVHGCIMVGNPGESKDTMEESFQFAMNLNCDSFQFYPLYVYPGTEAYQWAQNENLLLTNDFSKWIDEEGNHNCVINLPNLNRKEMVNFCDEAYKRYHLNFNYLMKKGIQLLVRPNEGIRSLKSGINFFSTRKNK